MTGVSEFIGFLVIKNVPSHSPGKPHVRRPFSRQKSGDALLVADPQLHRVLSSDEDSTVTPWEGQGPDHHAPVNVKQPTSRPALAEPDFWILAIIMLVCNILCPACLCIQ